MPDRIDLDTAYEPSDQATKEIDEILKDLIASGLRFSHRVTVADTRKLMILCWDRGYTARGEPKGET
jgi:hypothetical protein